MDQSTGLKRKIHVLQWVSFGLLIVGAVLLIIFLPLNEPYQTPQDRHFEIKASRFSFTPNEIKVNPGDRVTIKLVATDVVHGISVDNHDFELKADPGQPATGTFIARESGVYRFRCSVTCGNLHPFMIGKLSVGTNFTLYRGLAMLGFAVLCVFFFPGRQPHRSTP
jgi:heme/copper-type cytochrome/quinol oxidase subunit 2